MLNVLTNVTVVAFHFPPDDGHATFGVSSGISIAFISLSIFTDALSTPSLPAILLGKFKLSLLIVQESSKEKDQNDEEDEDAINYDRLVLFRAK